jgi:hypothetical protein
MMKKKLAILLLLATVVAFALSACTSDHREAYLLYSEAARKINGAESVSMNFDNDITMEGQTIGGIVKVSTEGFITLISQGLGKQMYVAGTAESDGQTAEITMYYRDGVSYTESEGVKYREEESLEEVMAGFPTSAEEFSASAVKRSAIRDVDGGREVTLTVNGDAMENTGRNTLTQLNVGEGVQLKYKDAKVVMRVDADGNPLEYRLDTEYEVSNASGKINTKIALVMNDFKIGGLKITFPTDLGSYPQASPNQSN